MLFFIAAAAMLDFQCRLLWWLSVHGLLLAIHSMPLQPRGDDQDYQAVQPIEYIDDEPSVEYIYDPPARTNSAVSSGHLLKEDKVESQQGGSGRDHSEHWQQHRVDDATFSKSIIHDKVTTPRSKRPASLKSPSTGHPSSSTTQQTTQATSSGIKTQAFFYISHTTDQQFFRRADQDSPWTSHILFLLLAAIVLVAAGFACAFFCCIASDDDLEDGRLVDDDLVTDNTDTGEADDDETPKRPAPGSLAPSKPMHPANSSNLPTLQVKNVIAPEKIKPSAFRASSSKGHRFRKGCSFQDQQSAFFQRDSNKSKLSRHLLKCKR